MANAARAASIDGMKGEALQLQLRDPLDNGYLSTVELSSSLWTAFPDPSSMFTHIALRYLPMMLVSDSFDPVHYGIDLITLRWSMDAELSPAPLAAAAPLSDRVIQWSPYVADFCTRRRRTSGRPTRRGRSTRVAAGERRDADLRTQSLHLPVRGLAHGAAGRRCRCGYADRSWLAEALAAPDVASADRSGPAPAGGVRGAEQRDPRSC